MAVTTLHESTGIDWSLHCEAGRARRRSLPQPSIATPPAAVPARAATARHIASHGALAARAWRQLLKAWQQWRAQVHARRQRRALAALPAHVLRDLGLWELARLGERSNWSELS